VPEQNEQKARSGNPLCYPRSATRHDQTSTITPQQEDTACSIRILLFFYEWLLNLWSRTLPRAGPQLGFPAEVFAVTWLLRPETKGYQENLETLLQSK
jgi:hypothetical protein